MSNSNNIPMSSRPHLKKVMTSAGFRYKRIAGDDNGLTITPKGYNSDEGSFDASLSSLSGLSGRVAVSAARVRAHNMKRFGVESPIVFNSFSAGDKPIIATDIDNVLVKFEKLLFADMKHHNCECLANVKGEPTSYNLVKNWFGGDLDHFTYHHDNAVFGSANAPTLDDTAAASIKKLQDNGFKVIALTARPEKFRGVTEAFLTNNGIVPDELIHDHNKTNHKFDAIIDDAPHNVDEIMNAGIPVVLRASSYMNEVSTKHGIELGSYTHVGSNGQGHKVAVANKFSDYSDMILSSYYASL